MAQNLGQVGQVDSRRVRGWDKSVPEVGQAGHNFTNKADQVGTGASMYQHVVVVGRLGADPEQRGGAVTFSVAVDDRQKSRETGQWEKTTEWFRCVTFGRTGEILASDARKGDRVLVEGKMRTSSWVDRDTGAKRYKTELIALFVRQLSSQRDGTRFEDAPPRRSPAPAPLDDDTPF